MSEEDVMAEDTSAMAEEDAMSDEDAMAEDTSAMAEEDAMSDEDAMAEGTSAMAEEDAMSEDSTAMAEGEAMAEDSTAMAEGEAMAEDSTATAESSAMADSAALLDVAGEAGLTGFVAAVAATDLAETLTGDGPYTIFAASDDVFAAYLAETGTDAGNLLDDPEALTTLLSGQIVEGELTIETLADGTCLTTLAGSGLLVAHDGDTVTVGGATVVEPDLHASNGVVHVVDQVLGG